MAAGGTWLPTRPRLHARLLAPPALQAGASDCNGSTTSVQALWQALLQHANADVILYRS